MRGNVLVTSTLPGVRPLGVRGEPLHNAQAQLRAVVRRRLGDRHFHLLAEPEPHALGGRIDWYCAVPGTVRRLAELPEPEREASRNDIDGLLADIDRTGQSLESGPTDDGRLAGRSLRLAARRPSDEHLFLVGDQPVVVCWGYDLAAAGAVLPAAFVPSTATPASPPPPPPLAPLLAMPAPVPDAPSVPVASAAAAARFPWLFWLLASLLAIAILMAASWLLRQYLPVEPDRRVTVLPGPPLPLPPPVRDPIPDLRRDVEIARGEEDKLRATLTALRDELGKRLAQCKPADPPRPPALPEDRWKKGDLALLEGCWILGRDSPVSMRSDNGPSIPGVQRAGRLCFDRSGHGTYEATADFPGKPALQCKATVTAGFRPDGTVRVEKPKVTCSDGSTQWNEDTLTCRRVDDNTATCSSLRSRADLEFRRASR